MSTYAPTLLGPFTPEDKDRIQAACVTHVHTFDGDTWHIRQPLNAKSIPLDDASATITRIAYTKAKSFGTMTEDEAPVDAPHHAGRDHALLSASSSARWLHCTPAPKLEEQYPDVDSPASAEGTAAHELAEWKLRDLNGETVGPRPESEWDNEDMDDHTDDYADNVMAELARTKETSPAAFLDIERRLDFSHIVPDGFGTGDAIIVGEPAMTIVDLKYGKGVKVDAQGNPQMRLYALGALRVYGMIYNIQQVRMVIFQPRIGNISIDEVSVDELNQWAEDVVKPRAQLAIDGEGELAAGDWCQFCKHAPQCAELAKAHFQTLPVVHSGGEVLEPEQPDPTTLSDEQIATIVTHAGDLKKWLSKVEAHALDQANQGHHYPGLKVVEGRSTRKWTDEDAVAKAVEATGNNPWEKKLLGITAMTKLLGKKTFDETVGDLLHKPQGKPTLVPVSDKRPEMALATPENVFTPITGGDAA